MAPTFGEFLLAIPHALQVHPLCLLAVPAALVECNRRLSHCRTSREYACYRKQRESKCTSLMLGDLNSCR